MIRTSWRMKSKHSGWAKGRCLHSKKKKKKSEVAIKANIRNNSVIWSHFHILCAGTWQRGSLNLNCLDKHFQHKSCKHSISINRSTWGTTGDKNTQQATATQIVINIGQQFKNTTFHPLLPFTEAVLVQLYKMASSPNVVHIGMDDRNFSPWNTSSRPSISQN